MFYYYIQSDVAYIDLCDLILIYRYRKNGVNALHVSVEYQKKT